MQLRTFGLLLCAIMNVRVCVCVCVEYLLQLGAGHGNEARDWGILKIYVEICASKIQNTAHRSTEGGTRSKGEGNEAHFIRIRNAYSKFILACTSECVCVCVLVLRHLAIARTNAHDHLATRSLIA